MIIAGRIALPAQRIYVGAKRWEQAPTVHFKSIRTDGL